MFTAQWTLHSVSTQFEPVSPEEDDKNLPIEDGQECTFLCH